eukprot:1149591-Pelagomonas_calceolata.AAC.2
MGSFSSSEHICAPFLAGCRRVKQLACDYKLADRPHIMQWLTKAYALPACMYASQIWGTRFMRPGAEMDCLLQTVHLCFLKRLLGDWIDGTVLHNVFTQTSQLTLRILWLIRKMHRNVWPTEDQAEHDGHPNKLAKYHNWVAFPFRHNSAFGKPLHVPRYLDLDLGRHMQRNIACLRLHAHKLKVETSLWHSPLS